MESITAEEKYLKANGLSAKNDGNIKPSLTFGHDEEILQARREENGVVGGLWFVG